MSEIETSLYWSSIPAAERESRRSDGTRGVAAEIEQDVVAAIDALPAFRQRRRRRIWRPASSPTRRRCRPRRRRAPTATIAIRSTSLSGPSSLSEGRAGVGRADQDRVRPAACACGRIYGGSRAAIAIVEAAAAPCRAHVVQIAEVGFRAFSGPATGRRPTDDLPAVARQRHCHRRLWLRQRHNRALRTGRSAQASNLTRPHANCDFRTNAGVATIATQPKTLIPRSY